MKKIKSIQVIDLTPPWYIRLIESIILFLSYKVEVPHQVMQKIITCTVTLSDGRVGRVNYRDYFKLDTATGIFQMEQTALKKFQNRTHPPQVAVRFSKDDWEPVMVKSVVDWGDAVTTVVPFTHKAIAVKLFGLTLYHEEQYPSRE